MESRAPSLAIQFAGPGSHLRRHLKSRTGGSPSFRAVFNLTSGRYSQGVRSHARSFCASIQVLDVLAVEVQARPTRTRGFRRGVRVIENHTYLKPYSVAQGFARLGGECVRTISVGIAARYAA